LKEEIILLVQRHDTICFLRLIEMLNLSFLLNNKIFSDNADAINEIFLIRIITFCVSIRYFEYKALILIISLGLAIEDVIYLFFFNFLDFNATGEAELAGNSFARAFSFVRALPE